MLKAECNRNATGEIFSPFYTTFPGALRHEKRKEKVDERVLDVVIDDSIPNKEAISFAPIDFEVKNEKSHMESEIKKYAKDKPDQVVDIIKSWLSENER